MHNITVIFLHCMYMQSGSCDCGLYAIANATAIANGDNPGSCRFYQEKMRLHLYHCLQAHNLQPFPHKKVGKGEETVKCTDDFAIYCHCRMPEIKNVPMIECSKCKKWFHAICEQVSDSALNISETEWLCCFC